MVLCPECGESLAEIDNTLHYCSNCKRYWIVHYDENTGDVVCICSADNVVKKLLQMVLANVETKEDS